MVKHVIKRDGTCQEFCFSKIKEALSAAFKASGYPVPESMFMDVQGRVENLYQDNGQSISVEAIQDLIEHFLMDSEYKDVAKSYIIYREKQKELRFIKDRVDYMEKYVESKENAATSSETDSNANVSLKNVANLDGEVYKSLNRQIHRYRMRKKLEEMFPEVATQYEKDLINHVIYVHDEASTPSVKNYCEAVTLYPLVSGTANVMDGLGATVPRGLGSFCGQLVNQTFLLAAQCKGAVAFGEFFNFFDYFCVKDFGEDYHLRSNEIHSTRPKKTILSTIHQAYQQIVYGWNQPAGNRSYQSPFTNISYYDQEYWKALFGEFMFPDGTKPSWERVDWLQKDFMRWFNKERTKALLTFPVETMALLSDGKDIIDQDYKNFTAEMYSKGHSFFTYISDNPNALASCCRLRNELDKNNFSFTSGLTGVQTGSCNVITLNLNRLVQDWFKVQDGNDIHAFYAPNSGFKSYLESVLERVYKYHIAYKKLLYEIEEKGMLSAVTAGYISMQKLYSTIGLNGINEAAEFMGLKCSYNEEYKKFCRLITGTISEQNRKHSTRQYRFNTELVPAENLSSKNYSWDKEDGYWVPENRVLYNSYFYLAEDPDTTVLDKFKLHGREFTELLDGGVGLHCNLEEHLTKEQYTGLIDFAIENGTSYFTFNVLNSECTNPECHHIVKVPLDVCPKCGAPMRHWTRIIGYLRPIESFDKHRQTEAKTRVYAGTQRVTTDMKSEKRI